ncbi:MAG: signal peptidase I [Deltaproteobacteria bacterium]|jgi:signal peptidase I|nr:signal peptidase I [Deltaproteobacteria bacterium]MBT4090504.1 signal peptidase I [Deltaproteobacteria bacterium]MBT4268085.1 signal peptidase I [Deltaproteobacteria bacterium]MBT4641447.1 signal peptidase I [Deltaproteobacteria bacterium]MBT6500062.1 signal peptidase I [Deltaproteobacteria bacterium]
MKKIINLERIIKNKTIREWVEALIFALIVAMIFRTWLYAPYRVPTGSMIHTIEIGDHLFVSKHAYGFVVPFTDIKLFPDKVERNDIVVFPYPEDPSIDFIKRIVAVGGDTVEVIGETVYINGEVEKADFVYYDNSLMTLPEHIKVTVPEGKLWAMGDNRRNSKDSRSWGFVDESSAEGKGVIIYWSHDPQQSLFSGYRFDRIGRFLE